MSLDDALLERLLERLDITIDGDTSVAGLRRAYAAWCASVPFDNTAKLIFLGSGVSGSLPGIDAKEFFQRLLTHGAGGTCWPSSNALFEVLHALGFDVRRSAASMRDTGIASHGTLKIRIGDDDWLADSSMLTNVPLPLGHDLFIHDEPVFHAEVEWEGGTHVIWWDAPPNTNWMPCRILSDDVSHDYYRERYEASRKRSPFNERIYARRNRPGEMLIITGNKRLSKTAAGVSSTELDEASLAESLRDEIAISGEMIGMLRNSPAWSASFKPPSSPPPPPSGPRPSARRPLQ